MDPYLVIQKQKAKDFLPEDYYFVFKNEHISLPIIINLTKIQRIPKKIKYIPLSTPYSYFKGITFHEGQTIPVIDLTEYVNPSSGLSSKWYEREPDNSVSTTTCIFKTKNNELIGLAGLTLYKQIHKSQIISETKLGIFLNEKIFSKAVGLENGEIMLLLDLEELFTRIKSEARDFFKKAYSLHSEKPYLVKTYEPSILVHGEKTEDDLLLELLSSAKKPGYEFSKSEELEYDLLVEISHFVYTFDLRNVFAVLKQFRVSPFPQTNNSLLIGWTQVKNQNIVIINPSVFSGENQKEDVLNDLTNMSLVVLSHPNIQGFWGIPVNKVLPATPREKRTGETKNVLGISSEIDPDLVFEAVSWRNGAPVFHVHTERFLKKISDNQVFSVDLTRKTKYLTQIPSIPQKTEEKPRAETLFIRTFHENAWYELEISDIRQIFRQLEVFPLEKNIPKVKGWVVYQGEVMPVIDLLEVINVSPLNRDSQYLTPTNYVVYIKEKQEKKSVAAVLTLPGEISIGPTSLTYPLEKIALEFLVENNYFQKIGLSSDSEKLVIILDPDRLFEEVLNIQSVFVSRHRPRKKELEQAREKDEYLKISEIERYKFKEENVGAFIFESSGILLGVDEQYLVSFVGKYDKLLHLIKELRDGSGSVQNNDSSTRIIILDSLFNKQYNLSSLSFIELSDNDAKLFVGFSEPFGIYYYDESDLVDLGSLSLEDRVEAVKALFSSIVEDFASKTGLENPALLFHAKFTFSKYFPELSGRSVLLLDYSKLKSIATPISEFWREKDNHSNINRPNKKRNQNGKSTDM